MPVITRAAARAAIEALLVPGGNITALELAAVVLDFFDSSAFTVEATALASHVNKSVLDLLTEVGGELRYNGVQVRTTTLSWENVSGKPLGVAGGVATLDGSAKIPLAQLPDSITGALEFVSLYNADTNTPVIPPADLSNKGKYYKVNVAGTQNINGTGDVEYSIGDWIISNGTIWDKIDSSENVTDWADLQNVPQIIIDISGLTLSGNSKYVGTDSGGVVGVFDLPAGGGGGYQPASDVLKRVASNIVSNNSLVFNPAVTNTPIDGLVQLKVEGKEYDPYTETILAGKFLRNIDDFHTPENGERMRFGLSGVKQHYEDNGKAIYFQPTSRLLYIFDAINGGFGKNVDLKKDPSGDLLNEAGLVNLFYDRFSDSCYFWGNTDASPLLYVYNIKENKGRLHSTTTDATNCGFIDNVFPAGGFNPGSIFIPQATKNYICFQISVADGNDEVFLIDKRLNKGVLLGSGYTPANGDAFNINSTTQIRVGGISAYQFYSNTGWMYFQALDVLDNQTGLIRYNPETDTADFLYTGYTPASGDTFDYNLISLLHINAKDGYEIYQANDGATTINYYIFNTNTGEVTEITAAYTPATGDTLGLTGIGLVPMCFGSIIAVFDFVGGGSYIWFYDYITDTGTRYDTSTATGDTFDLTTVNTSNFPTGYAITEDRFFIAYTSDFVNYTLFEYNTITDTGNNLVDTDTYEGQAIDMTFGSGSVTPVLSAIGREGRGTIYFKNVAEDEQFIIYDSNHLGRPFYFSPDGSTIRAKGAVAASDRLYCNPEFLEDGILPKNTVVSMEYLTTD